MKSIAIIALLALLVAPCTAELTMNQTAYVQGRDAGFELGIVFWQGLGNATAAQLYNEKVAAWNSLCNDTLSPEDVAMQRLLPMPMPDDSYLPEVVRNWDGKNVWN